jgi:hypothetical protein
MGVVQHICLEKKHFPKTCLVFPQEQDFPQKHGYVSPRRLHFPKEHNQKLKG